MANDTGPPVSRSNIDQDSRFANPNKAADEDASKNSSVENPLLPGKKQVADQPLQEWGTLRMGVKKEDTAFGLPKQTLPGSLTNDDPNDNDGNTGGNVEAAFDMDGAPSRVDSYTKGNNEKGDSVT